MFSGGLKAFQNSQLSQTAEIGPEQKHRSVGGGGTTCIYTYICIHVYMYIKMYLYMCICVCRSVYMHIRTYRFLSVCICIRTYTKPQNNGETQKPTKGMREALGPKAGASTSNNKFPVTNSSCLHLTARVSIIEAARQGHRKAAVLCNLPATNLSMAAIHLAKTSDSLTIKAHVRSHMPMTRCL